MYESIAVKLRLSPQELEPESLRLFLHHQLRRVESQLLSLAHKYGVHTVTELDELVQTGQVHEAEAFEDYFESSTIWKRNATCCSVRWRSWFELV
jgi:hypothetical protein